MMRATSSRIFVAALLLGLATLPAHAGRKPFKVDLTIGSQSPPTAGFATVTDTVNYLDPDSIAALGLDVSPSYDPITATLDFRGMTGITLDFVANSGELVLDIPQFGSHGPYTFGRTCDTTGQFPDDCRQARKEALREVRDFLESNPAFLKRMLTLLARYSPIDPLAGNPDSLFSRSMRADFQQGFTHKVSQIWGCSTTAYNDSFGSPMVVAAVGDNTDIFADARAREAALQGQNEIGVGLMYSTTTAESSGGDFATTGIVVPLSYTIKLDSDPRRKVRIDLPLGYADTDGATSYSAGVGVAYTHPLSDVWTLTPALGVGATGSDDLGSAGGVSSYSVTSAYTWRLGGFALSMGNAIGKYDALSLKIGDVEAEADLSNTVFTNGLLLTGPNSLIARNLVMEYTFTDTRITGDEVYADTYDEVGIALGYLKSRGGVIDSYSKVGMSYLVGSGDADDISSLRLNLAMRF
jgi:hypothetical protein